MRRAWILSIGVVLLWARLGGASGVASAVIQHIPPHEMSEEQKFDQAKALYMEGQEAFDAGDPVKALAAWEEAYNVYAPSLHVFSFNIGRAAFEAGDCELARVAFERFLLLVPEHPARADAGDALDEIRRMGCVEVSFDDGRRTDPIVAGDARLSLVDEGLEVEIDHQHAHGVLRRRFDNRVGRTVEGSFRFDGGQKNHVVGFAYWNQAEKIVGEVFERQVAARIYRDTVDRGRDPGLLVSAGDGLFRFTVFPILANERKKVEVQFEQWLTRHGDQMELRVPMMSMTANVDITLHDERRLAAFVSPTHQVAVGREANGDFHIRSGRSRPEADALVLRWTVEDAPGQLRSYVHRDEGQDAYLVLTMVPPVNRGAMRIDGIVTGRGPTLALSDLKLRATGLRLHGIHPQTIPGLLLDEELVVVARVEGSGSLDLRLTGESAAGPFVAEERVKIPARSNRPWVGRVWARHRVGHLLDRIESDGETLELVEETLELSLAYDIVTPYTAFLAMPESELMADTAELMRHARAYKQRVLADHPDRSAIRGMGRASGSSRPSGAPQQATSVAEYESMESEESPRGRRRDKGSAAGCASCTTGEGPGGVAGSMLVLLIMLRRRRGQERRLVS